MSILIIIGQVFGFHFIYENMCLCSDCALGGFGMTVFIFEYFDD